MYKQIRKKHRLSGFDYSSAASYLLTFNTVNRNRLLSEIVFTDIFSPPGVQLLPFGLVINKYILQIEEYYPDVTVENYVIMPDHVHLLITIEKHSEHNAYVQSTVARIIHALKSLTTKEIGESIWQADFYDTIADSADLFDKLSAYVDNNPAVWIENHGSEPPLPK